MINFSLETQPLWVILLVRIGGAVLIFLVGRWLAGFLQRSVRAVMKRTRATPALTEILARGTYYGILVLAVSLALITLGIPATVLLGTLGIIIVVAAVALRESLRDLAALDKVRIDLTVRLSYVDGVQQVKDMLVALAKADTRVLETPAPFVQVMELGDSQVEYALRAYTSPADAWSVRPALNEQIKTWMEERKINLPLPQLQVHGSPTMQTSSVTPLSGNGQS